MLTSVECQQRCLRTVCGASPYAKGLKVISFGRPPPDGCNSVWAPAPSAGFRRSVCLTDGLKLRLHVRSKHFEISSSVGQCGSTGSWQFIWTVKDLSDDDVPVEHKLFEASGPDPADAMRLAWKAPSLNKINFRVVSSLGFTNPLFLAQLDRAYHKGQLPRMWTPHVSAGLDDNGKLGETHAKRLLCKICFDDDLRRSLSHLLPEPVHAVSTMMSCYPFNDENLSTRGSAIQSAQRTPARQPLHPLAPQWTYSSLQAPNPMQLWQPMASPMAAQGQLLHPQAPQWTYPNPQAHRPMPTPTQLRQPTACSMAVPGQLLHQQAPWTYPNPQAHCPMPTPTQLRQPTACSMAVPGQLLQPREINSGLHPAHAPHPCATSMYGPRPLHLEQRLQQLSTVFTPAPQVTAIGEPTSIRGILEEQSQLQAAIVTPLPGSQTPARHGGGSTSAREDQAEHPQPGFRGPSPQGADPQVGRSAMEQQLPPRAGPQACSSSAELQAPSQPGMQPPAPQNAASLAGSPSPRRLGTFTDRNDRRSRPRAAVRADRQAFEAQIAELQNKLEEKFLLQLLLEANLQAEKDKNDSLRKLCDNKQQTIRRTKKRKQEYKEQCKVLNRTVCSCCSSSSRPCHR